MLYILNFEYIFGVLGGVSFFRCWSLFCLEIFIDVNVVFFFLIIDELLGCFLWFFVIVVDLKLDEFWICWLFEFLLIFFDIVLNDNFFFYFCKIFFCFKFFWCLSNIDWLKCGLFKWLWRCLILLGFLMMFVILNLFGLNFLNLVLFILFLMLNRNSVINI